MAYLEDHVSMTQAATLTLTDFLLARIAEDTALAKSARASSGPYGWCDSGWDEMRQLAREEGAADQAMRLVEHFDPERVLAECEWKRWLVELVGVTDYSRYDDPEIMRRLAAVYAAHPDYREEWKP